MIKKQFTAAVIALQFVTVQFQAAYGNTELAKFSAEHQQTVRIVKEKISHLLESKTEEEKENLAYSLYKLGVRARNHAAKWTNAKFERRLTHAMNRDEVKNMPSENLNTEEVQMASEVETNADLNQLATMMGNERSAMPATAMQQAKAQSSVESKKSILGKLDPVLLSLGSESLTNGKLSVATKEVFLRDGLHTVKTKELRAPAADDLLVDLITLIIFAVCVVLVIYLALTIVAIFLSPLFWLCMVVFMCSGGFWVVIRV